MNKPTMTIEEAKRRMQETAVFAHDHARKEYYKAFGVIEAAHDALLIENASLKVNIGNLDKECNAWRKRSDEFDNEVSKLRSALAKAEPVLKAIRELPLCTLTREGGRLFLPSADFESIYPEVEKYRVDCDEEGQHGHS